MEIKVLGIHGSPRNGATAQALREALRFAEEVPGAVTQFMELRKMKISPCIHCNRCLKETEPRCPAFDDDMKLFYELIPQADVLVLASPVYQMAASAQMHAFMNRLRPLGKLIVRGDWARKVGVGVAVGGARNGGEETTLDVINRFFISTGMNLAGGGVFSYVGGSIWSNDGMAKGTMQDTVGLKTVAVSVRRAVVLAKLIKYGLEAAPAMQPAQLAGFRDEEEALAYTSEFSKRQVD